MTNRNRYQNEVIDLTVSFTSDARETVENVVIDLDSVVRETMENIVIDLDASVNDNNRPSKTRSPKNKKNSSSRIHDLRSPKKVEKPEKKKRSGFGNCPICFDKLGTNQMGSTKCGHVFCLRCLERALRREKKCPTCRCVLKGGSAYHPLYLSDS